MSLITTDKNNLLHRCRTRGYDLRDVMPCVVSQDGDTWTIDTDHESYPHPKYHPDHPINEEIKPPEIGEGVGTELKKLLSLIGINSSPTCKCNRRAKIINENGVEWAKENVEEISSWMEEEAKNRNLPYFKYVGKKIIKLAIFKAERKLKNV